MEAHRVGWDGILDPDNGVDSDTDSLTDWEEVDTARISWDTDGSVILPTIQDCIGFVEKGYAEEGLTRYKQEHPVIGMPLSSYVEYVLGEIKILPIYSDPTEEDSDGDGLLDGTRVFYEGKVLLPPDQEPLKYNGPKGAWLAQAEMVREGKIPTEYTSEKTYPNEAMNKVAENADFWVEVLLNNPWLASEDIVNWVEKKIREDADGYLAHIAGADFLDFIYDEYEMAYHSQVETWQRAFGYNDIYDQFFEYGSDMSVNKMPFLYGNKEYILWMWKGDYWNLQGGAETGLYVRNVKDMEINGIEHYEVVDFELPMTLSLFRRTGDRFENVFGWVPRDEQWWITGFSPEYTEPNPEEMLTICSVDFSKKSEMWKRIVNDLSVHDNVIFDENLYTIWIVWD